MTGGEKRIGGSDVNGEREKEGEIERGREREQMCVCV